MRGKSFLFFSAATVMVGAFFILGLQDAHAYAIPSTSTSQPMISTGVNSDYNFSGSLQNLFSPFQGFFQSLQWNTSATTDIDINPTSTPIPAINISPSLQNNLTQPFTDFDNWFYGLTGFRLSGLVVAVLSGLSWALGIAKGIVDWLLGLFH
jgi:hypothetical protein